MAGNASPEDVRRRAADLFDSAAVGLRPVGTRLAQPLIFHAATGSFPNLLPFSPPLLIPLVIVFMIGAVVSSPCGGSHESDLRCANA
jgi:hypothetical protein